MAKHQELPEGCYSEQGKGRKLCPGCDNYIAARSTTCPACNHVFEKKDKKVAQQRTIKTIDEPEREVGFILPPSPVTTQPPRPVQAAAPPATSTDQLDTVNAYMQLMQGLEEQDTLARTLVNALNQKLHERRW